MKNEKDNEGEKENECQYERHFSQTEANDEASQDCSLQGEPPPSSRAMMRQCFHEDYTKCGSFKPRRELHWFNVNERETRPVPNVKIKPL
jgi:hypothetical protein